MNLKVRLWTAAVAIAFGLTAIILNAYIGYTVAIACAVIAAGCVFELLRCMGITFRSPFFWCAEAYTLGMLLVFTPDYTSVARLRYIQAALCILLILSAVICALVVRKKDERGKIVFTAAVTALITVGFCCIAFWSTLYVMQDGVLPIVPLVVLLFCLLGGWISDTGGYFIGSNWGKHKLAPKISPKKSIEGLIGSIVSVPLVFLGVAWGAEAIARGQGWAFEVSYPLVLLLGLACSFVATGGDLAFSIIKRYRGIKDYGSIMPGHGGFLDRFDSVIFTSIFVTLAVALVPVFRDFSVI